MSYTTSFVGGEYHDHIPTLRQNANGAVAVADENVARRGAYCRDVRVLNVNGDERGINLEELCLFGIGFVLRQRFCVEEAELSPLGVSLTLKGGQGTFASDMIWAGRDSWSC